MCVRVMERWLPDPFIFCALLTFIVFIGAIFLTKATPLQVIGFWADGFWNLLAFSMQMALVLVTGHTLASSKLFKKMLSTFASGIKGPKQAILIVSIVSGIACALNWGFGLVIGALFAKEIAKKVKGVDYRLLIASATQDSSMAWRIIRFYSITTCKWRRRISKTNSRSSNRSYTNKSNFIFTNEYFYSCRTFNNSTFIKYGNVPK